MKAQIVIVSFLLALLAPCLPAMAAEDAFPPTEARLMERATSYWDAAKANDVSTLFRMEAAAAKGELSPAQAKNALGTSKLVGYEFGAIEVKDGTALIQVDARYSLAGMKSTFNTRRVDAWVYMNGDWYHDVVDPRPTQ